MNECVMAKTWWFFFKKTFNESEKRAYFERFQQEVARRGLSLEELEVSASEHKDACEKYEDKEEYFVAPQATNNKRFL